MREGSLRIVSIIAALGMNLIIFSCESLNGLRVKRSISWPEGSPESSWQPEEAAWTSWPRCEGSSWPVWSCSPVTPPSPFWSEDPQLSNANLTAFDSRPKSDFHNYNPLLHLYIVDNVDHLDFRQPKSLLTNKKNLQVHQHKIYWVTSFRSN